MSESGHKKYELRFHHLDGVRERYFLSSWHVHPDDVIHVGQVIACVDLHCDDAGNVSPSRANGSGSR
ncbi:hypothetical protein OKA05_08225 [Luteolibacter arcticus]|uniref:Uncharacterized protein n=1 Tax=Luteolibacter arcticus TaxID=1581411 RepID=A0ABT3GFZ1_9BACT|nr:hypothetical protein [Luteolibacter arcticus]MCW1922538.1 hypothetical protein [Luteolibacter arcticus]